MTAAKGQVNVGGELGRVWVWSCVHNFWVWIRSDYDQITFVGGAAYHVSRPAWMCCCRCVTSNGQAARCSVQSHRGADGDGCCGWITLVSSIFQALAGINWLHGAMMLRTFGVAARL